MKLHSDDSLMVDIAVSAWSSALALAFLVFLSVFVIQTLIL